MKQHENRSHGRTKPFEMMYNGTNKPFDSVDKDKLTKRSQAFQMALALDQHILNRGFEKRRGIELITLPFKASFYLRKRRTVIKFIASQIVPFLNALEKGDMVNIWNYLEVVTLLGRVKRTLALLRFCFGDSLYTASPVYQRDKFAQLMRLIIAGKFRKLRKVNMDAAKLIVSDVDSPLGWKIFKTHPLSMTLLGLAKQVRRSVSRFRNWRLVPAAIPDHLVQLKADLASFPSFDGRLLGRNGLSPAVQSRLERSRLTRLLKITMSLFSRRRLNFSASLPLHASATLIVELHKEGLVAFNPYASGIGYNTWRVGRPMLYRDNKPWFKEDPNILGRNFWKNQYNTMELTNQLAGLFYNYNVTQDAFIDSTNEYTKE